MSRYAILHIEKCKHNTYALGRHILRQQQPENANPDRSHLNVNYITPEGNNLNAAINNRIRDGYKGKKAIRKDAVKALSIIMTGSHDVMKEIESKGSLKSWVNNAYIWLCDKFGEKNIVTLSLHMDEHTPHLHAVVVPLTKDGRLCAKEVLGNREKMRNLQTSFWAMVGRMFRMDRGLKRSRARHTDITEYYTLLKNQDKLAKLVNLTLDNRQNRYRGKDDPRLGF